jgi:hypothetical protein
MLFFLLLGGLWLLIATGHPPDLFGWLMVVGAGYVCGFVEARWVVGRGKGGDSAPLPDQVKDNKDLGDDIFATR